MKKETITQLKYSIKKTYKGPYKFLLILWFVLYLGLNYFLNEIGTIGLHIFTYPIYIYLPYVVFMLLNAKLVAISINLSILKFKEFQQFNVGTTSLGAAGTFIALMTGACPGCIAGFFPVVMGLFGSSITLSQLPLYGLELQIISIPLLLSGIYLLSKPTTCKIKPKKKKKK